MTAQRHIIFWSLAFAGFLLFVYVFKSVLLPFVLGGAVAYLLNPVVAKICKGGLSRKYAAMIILLLFFLFVAILLAALLPFLYRELLDFSDDAPKYIEKLITLSQPVTQLIQDFTNFQTPDDLKAALSEHAGSAANVARHIIGGMAAGGQAAAGFLSVLVIMPVVAYFMMKEWVSITNWTEDMIPRAQKKTVMDLLRDIDAKLSGFVRGQISVAFILAVFYAIALSVAGLKYGLLVGLGAGLLSVIPMVGSAVGFVVGVGLAWFETGDWTFVLLIAGIFLGGQFVEGNFLTPKLVGDSVGLHPLWIFFALMAGGSLFGILGMLLAVPVAAVASVLAAFAINRYKSSSYYTGKTGQAKDQKS